MVHKLWRLLRSTSKDWSKTASIPCHLLHPRMAVRCTSQFSTLPNYTRYLKAPYQHKHSKCNRSRLKVWKKRCNLSRAWAHSTHISRQINQLSSSRIRHLKQINKQSSMTIMTHSNKLSTIRKSDHLTSSSSCSNRLDNSHRTHLRILEDQLSRMALVLVSLWK